MLYLFYWCDFYLIKSVYSCLEANRIKDVRVSKQIGCKMWTWLFLRSSRDLLAINDFWLLSSSTIQHWLEVPTKVWGNSCPIAWLDIHLSSGDKIAQEGFDCSVLCSFLLIFYHIAVFWNMFHRIGHICWVFFWILVLLIFFSSV